MKAIFALIVLALSPAAYSQMVLQADAAKLQPQIGRDQAGFNSCGIRAVVLTHRGKTVDTYDFSLMLFSKMYTGMLKAGKYQTSMKDFLAGKTDGPAYIPAPNKIWIAKEAEGAPLISKKIIPSETKGFTLASTDFVKTLDVMTAMAAGERMQFAVRYKTEPYDVVLAFSAGLPEQEMTPLLTCTRSLIERMRQEIEAE